MAPCCQLERERRLRSVAVFRAAHRKPLARISYVACRPRSTIEVEKLIRSEIAFMPLTAFAGSVSSNAVLAGGRSNAARTIGASAISPLYDRLAALARPVGMRQCSRVGSRPNLPKLWAYISSRSINVCSREPAYRPALREKAVPRGSRTASSFSSIVSLIWLKEKPAEAG